jgi:hypothetical protein
MASKRGISPRRRSDSYGSDNWDRRKRARESHGTYEYPDHPRYDSHCPERDSIIRKVNTGRVNHAGAPPISRASDSRKGTNTVLAESTGTQLSFRQTGRERIPNYSKPGTVDSSYQAQEGEPAKPKVVLKKIHELRDEWSVMSPEKYAAGDLLLISDVQPSSNLQGKGVTRTPVLGRKDIPVYSKARPVVVLETGPISFTYLPMNTYNGLGLKRKTDAERRRHIRICDHRRFNETNKDKGILTPHRSLMTAEMREDFQFLDSQSHIRLGHPDSLHYNSEVVRLGRLASAHFTRVQHINTAIAHQPLSASSLPLKTSVNMQVAQVLYSAQTNDEALQIADQTLQAVHDYVKPERRIRRSMAMFHRDLYEGTYVSRSGTAEQNQSSSRDDTNGFAYASTLFGYQETGPAYVPNNERSCATFENDPSQSDYARILGLLKSVIGSPSATLKFVEAVKPILEKEVEDGKLESQKVGDDSSAPKIPLSPSPSNVGEM